MGNFVQDLRYCFRTLRKHPSFTIVACVTLALGIGASTALFSIVNVVVLNPFPYTDPSKLFFVRQSLPKIGVSTQFRSSGPEFDDLAQSQVFERIAAYEGVSRNLTGAEEPERVPAAKVSTEFFNLLGIKPILGRTISPEEQGPNGQRVLVISHSLWQRRFGGETGVLGKTVALDDEPFTIIGVMPANFRFDEAQAWFPFPFDLAKGVRTGRQFMVLGRIKSDSPFAQTNAQLEALTRRQEAAYASTNPEYVGRTVYLQSLNEFYFGTVRRALLILLGAVALVLLIACANIANLLLAKSTARSHEIAIRAAMGASRSRIVRQMLTESFVLALLGGGLGLLLAAWGTRGLVAVIPTGTIPPGLDVLMDTRVLVFTLVVSLATAVIFGLWPALQMSRTQVRAALQSGSHRTTTGSSQRRTQSLLVVAEIGLSLILLVGSGLMVRSFSRLTNIDPGLNTRNTMTMRINRSPAKSQNGAKNAQFFQQVIDHVKTVPGVEAVAVSSHMPFVYTEDWTVTIDSPAIPQDSQTLNIDTRTVSADYFSVMQIPLVTGEGFSAAEEQQPVVVVNQTMANRFWPNDTAVGKRIRPGPRDSKIVWFTIKGVVKDSAQGYLDVPVKPEAYFVLSQLGGQYRRMNLAVRTTTDPKSLVGAIQSAIREVDHDQPVYQIQTTEELITESIGTRRFALFMLVLFGLLALVLAASGIFGVISYAVAQRTQEIGIRVALGASSGDVLRLVVGQCLWLTLIGVSVGLAGAFALTRLMNSLLFGVTATDLTTFMIVPLVLILVALLASFIPARRATKVDPLVALRYE